MVGTALAAAACVGLAPSASAGVSGVAFGSLVASRGTETFAQAVARQDAAYGTMPISRVFYNNGGPEAWPGKAGLSGRSVVVSFKYAPSLVLTGQYDAALTNFFATAPTDREVYWSYIHEPEDNIANGEFTSADYRTAWQRVADLAKAAASTNVHLHATLILMCYTLNPASGLDWHNYYVPTAQTMLAFDCYNHAGKRGGYGSPASIFKPLTDWSAANPTIPWGVSEFGSVLVPSDLDGSLRAAWLRSVGTFLVDQHADPRHAIFGIYYDTVGPKGTDYRLVDANSQAAWREVVQTY